METSTISTQKNKQSVGRRLALIALANVYKESLAKGKKNLVYSGPTYESCKPEENAIRINFTHAQGLRIRGDEELLTGFTICGKDHKFVPAEARIVGETVYVSSPEIKNPVAVRFAWNDTAQPNLINAGLLPASPFRTDDFPLPSKVRDF